MIRKLPSVFIALLVAACVSAGTYVTYRSGEPTLSGRLCKPEGPGPFAAVIFNHGGLGSIIGGAPDATCAALAEAGYVGFSPIRRLTRPLFGHLDDVAAAIDYVKSVPGVDGARLGMIGFSRGGMLTFQTAVRRNDLKAVVIMAAAAGPRGDALTSEDASAVTAPVLILVAENDTGSRTTMGGNTLRYTRELAAALKAAKRDAELIVYPPYGSDGHQLFFSVGDYWPDVTAFLDRNLKR